MDPWGTSSAPNPGCQAPMSALLMCGVGLSCELLWPQVTRKMQSSKLLPRRQLMLRDFGKQLYTRGRCPAKATLLCRETQNDKSSTITSNPEGNRPQRSEDGTDNFGKA